MSQTHGPKITIQASCSDCIHCHSEYYRCQGDSGFDHYCTHASFPERRHISAFSCRTPDWCPYGSVNRLALIQLAQQFSGEEWDELRGQL